MVKVTIAGSSIYIGFLPFNVELNNVDVPDLKYIAVALSFKARYLSNVEFDMTTSPSTYIAPPYPHADLMS